MNNLFSWSVWNLAPVSCQWWFWAFSSVWHTELTFWLWLCPGLVFFCLLIAWPWLLTTLSLLHNLIACLVLFSKTAFISKCCATFRHVIMNECVKWIESSLLLDNYPLNDIHLQTLFPSVHQDFCQLWDVTLLICRAAVICYRDSQCNSFWSPMKLWSLMAVTYTVGSFHTEV